MDSSAIELVMDSLIKGVSAFKGVRDSLNDQLKELEGREDELVRSRELLRKCETLFTQLVVKVTEQSLERFTSLVTRGIQYVFSDPSLVFSATVEKFRGKTAVKFSMGEDVPILQSYGGGLVTVISVLVRVYVIMSIEGRRVLFLDESLSHLSRDYVPRISKLLRKLSEELGFKILMISQDPTFTSECTSHYEAVRKQDKGTVFEKRV